MSFRNLRRGRLSPEEEGHFSLVFWTLATRIMSTYVSVVLRPQVCSGLLQHPKNRMQWVWNQVQEPGARS